MRELFVWFFKLNAWLAPFVSAYYGYVIAADPPSNMGFIGGFLGFILGGLGWLLYMGLADLAETTWSNQRALIDITERLEKMAKTAGTEEAEEAAQLAAMVSKITEVKTSIDDLQEGLSDVMEETLQRISGIKDAVTTPPKVQPAAPAIDLSQIKPSDNR
jgi:hypothetical protein